MSRGQRLWTLQEIEAVEALRTQKLSYRQIGEKLGRSASSVSNKHLQIRRGKRVVSIRGLWHPKEVALLKEMLANGKNTNEIARRLHRPRWSVLGWMKRNGIKVGDYLGDYWLSVERLATLFGIRPPTVRFFIKCGALRGVVRDKESRSKHIIVSRDEIEKFVTKSEWWMIWRPELITDYALKSYAQELRQQAGWHWMTSTEASVTLGYSPDSLCHIENVKRLALPFKKVRGYRYFRSDEVERAKNKNG